MSALAPSVAALLARVQESRSEIETAVLTRVHAISDPSEVSDPTYAEGLRTAISTAIDYALEAIERGEQRTPPPPPPLLAQARMAARNGVGLDTVLRRYLAGYTLLGGFLAREARRAQPSHGVAPSDLWSGIAVVLDRLLAAVTEEYNRESRQRPDSSGERRAERVERLLAGEPLDTSDIAYDFDAQHLGLAASSPEPISVLREIATALDLRLLVVHRASAGLWAWLGASRPIDLEDLRRRLEVSLPSDLPFAVGEPAAGLSGWRLTHRQAAAALPLAALGSERIVRYGDVALLVSALQDDLLGDSLRRLYLEPLEAERDGGATLRQALRAYLAAGGNLSAAGARLAVSRRTVSNRLRRVEELVERPVYTALAEIATALRLDAHLAKEQDEGPPISLR